MSKPKTPKPVKSAAPPAGSRCPFRLVPISSVQPERMDWLWPGRIPYGEVTVLAGVQGLGKSYVGQFIATVMSHGSGSWPDGCAVQPRGETIILDGGENDESRVIRPRLDAMAADGNKIMVVHPVGDDDLVNLGNKDGLRWLAELLTSRNGAVRLVLIDCFADFFPDVNPDKNSEVRKALRPLAKLAREFKLAVVGVTHQGKPRPEGGKGAIHRVLGSTAWTAVPRCGVSVYQGAGKDDRVLATMKLNVGRFPPNIGFRVVDSGALEWTTDVSDASADELSEPAAVGKGKLERCSEWLQGRLLQGPASVTALQAEAEGKSFSAGTFKNARKALRLPTPVHAGGPWVLFLAGQEAEADALAAELKLQAEAVVP